MKNQQEYLATLTSWSRNVTTSTREPTTRAWIHDVRMALFVLKIEKLSHMGPRESQDLRSPSPIMAPEKAGLWAVIFVPFGLGTSDRRKPAKCLSPRREENKIIHFWLLWFLVWPYNKHLINRASSVCMGDYYMALSHKDWELPNSRIWLAKTDIDRGLDFPI